MKKKTTLLWSLLIVALIACSLSGCKKETDEQATGEIKYEEPTVETIAPSEESDEEEEMEEIKEEQPKVTEETTTEEETEEEKEEGPEREIVNEVENEDGTITVFSKQKAVTEEEKAIEEWVTSLEEEKTKLAIWNTETGEKEFLQLEKVYQLEENDKLILCYGEDKEKYKISFEPTDWLEEVKKYPRDGKYYTELKYREGSEKKNITFHITHLSTSNEEYYNITLP